MQAKKEELGRPNASWRDLKKATNQEGVFGKKVRGRKISFSTVTNHLNASGRSLRGEKKLVKKTLFSLSSKILGPYEVKNPKVRKDLFHQ